MSSRFTAEEVVKLFWAALGHRETQRVAVALKAAEAAGLPAGPLLMRALSGGADWPLITTLLARAGMYGRRDVVLEASRSDVRDVRRAAAEALKRLQTAGDPPQLSALDEDDYAYAEVILGRELLPQDTRSLFRRLSHWSEEVRLHASQSLARCAVPVAHEVFFDLAAGGRKPTAELLSLLGELRDPRASSYLIGYLRDDRNWSFREVALDALVQIADPEAVRYVAGRALEREHLDWEVERAFGKIGAPAIALVLREYAENDELRRRGAARVARLAGAAALPPLLEALQDRFREVREGAEAGLKELGGQAVEPLIDVLRRGDGVAMRHACRVLGRIRDARALEPLLAAARGEDKEVRWEAIEAIGSLPVDNLAEVLSEWLHSPDAETRRRALASLFRRPKPEALPELFAACADPDRSVRMQAMLPLDEFRYMGSYVRNLLTNFLISKLVDDDAEIASLAAAELTELGSLDDDVRGLIESSRGATTGSRRRALSKIIKSLAERSARQQPGPLNPDEVFARASRSGRGELDAEYSTSDEWDVKFFHPLRPGGGRALPSGRGEPEPAAPKPATDAVHVSVTAPRLIVPEQSFMLDVWAHFGRERGEVLKRAEEMQGGRPVGARSKGPVPVERNTTLEVRLSIPDFGVEGVRDSIYWAGEAGNCTFRLKVPRGVAAGFHEGSADFCVGALRLCTLFFDLEVGAKEAAAAADVTTREEWVRTAFASYASEDRDEVLGRIQGMLKLSPTLNVFLDVASLRSGEDWEKRVREEIVARDVFYLFWSRAASRSHWVDVEWRTALNTKGLGKIDPVPLEPPEMSPPPPELSALHFNDWTLAFKKKTRRKPVQRKKRVDRIPD